MKAPFVLQPESGIHFVLYNETFDVIEENTGVLLVDDKINTIQTLATDKMIMQESGFLEISVNNNAQTPVYYDNLMAVQSSGPVSEVNAYYPFGMIIPNLSTQALPEEYNAYKYSAKELQTELNLNWGDHGARMADYTVGRWWVPDPLAEKYYNISTYVYCANNPVRYIDPDGRDWTETEEEDENGNKYIKFTVTAGVRNSSSMSDKEISKRFDEIKEQFESSFQGKEGNVTYSATLIRDDSEKDFYFDFVDNVTDSEGNIRGSELGRVQSIGNTKKNRLQVLANDNHDMGNTGVHELGHTGGLTHESYLGNMDLNGVDMGDFQTNLMKGGPPPGFNITVPQLKYIHGVIRNGYKPTPVYPKIERR